MDRFPGQRRDSLLVPSCLWVLDLDAVTRYPHGDILQFDTLVFFSRTATPSVLGGWFGFRGLWQRRILVRETSNFSIKPFLKLPSRRKRMQMGIVIGFVINIAFGLWVYITRDG